MSTQPFKGWCAPVHLCQSKMFMADRETVILSEIKHWKYSDTVTDPVEVTS